MPAPHHSFFTGRMPFLPPNQQRQSTEGKAVKLYNKPNSSVLSWRCRLMQVELYNGCETVVVVVVTFLVARNALNR